jgi:autotransporter-associated beta strand protein
MINNFLKRCLGTTGAVVVLLSCSAGQASTISVNFVQNFVPAQTVDANVPYGVESVLFWTNINGNGPSNLRDNTNTPTTLDLAITGGGSKGTYGGAQLDGTPMRASHRTFDAGNSPVFTFSEIPYANYKVIAYLAGGNANDSHGSLSDGTTTYFWRPKPFSAVLDVTTDTDPNDGLTQANYAIFGSDSAPLSGSSQAFTMNYLASSTAGIGIGGFQIVEAAPSTDIVIDVASGSQTQAQAGYASISTATSVTKTGVGTVVFDAANAYTGPTTISAGTLELTNPDGLGFTTVTVDTGATLAVASGTTMKSPAVIVDGGVISGGALAVNSSTGIASLAINAGSIAGSPTVTIADGGQMALVQDARVSVSIGGLSVDQGTGGGRLDVGGGQVTVGAGGITAEDLRADIIAGRNGGAWNGTTGITSSAAAAVGGTRAVGYVVAGDGSARVSFSAPGDTNINGQVDVFDLVAVNSGGKYGTGTAAVWSEGDFNYDGVTNVFDLVSTNSAGAYGQGDYFPAAPTAVGSVAAVPEPATFLSLAVAGLAAGLVVSRRLHWRSLA